MSAANSPFNPTDRILRQFAAMWIVFFLAVAAAQEFRHGRHTLAIVLAVLAVTLGPLGVAWPRTIRPIFIGWMTVAYPIGWVVSHVVLGSIFFGLFTPIAVILRMIGRDSLGLRVQPTSTTYWQAKERADASQYLRQF